MKFCWYYIILKVDLFYRKRVLWIEIDSVREECIVVVEYLGKYLCELICGKYEDKLIKMGKEFIF